MGTVPVKVEIGSGIGFHALFETGERKPLSSSVKTIRTSGEMTVGDIRPAVAIISSFKESFSDQLFISGIVIN